MISQLQQLGRDFISIVYPPHCIECGQQIHASRKIFCIKCHSIIGYTDHFLYSKNDLLNRISPRIIPQHSAALLNYVKEGVVQNAIHKLKYSGRYDIGIYFGELFGEAYVNSPLFNLADYIVPIPIHRSRKRKREYNQSEVFAKGIRNKTGIKVDTKVLIKQRSLLSQTKKGRADRFETVLNSFRLTDLQKFEGKTILLIDDVLTTGATIEAAYTMLSKIPNIKIQLGLIALASN